MRVTGALLAESAAVVDGKLDIENGFLSSYRPGADRVAAVTLVVFAEFETADTAAELTVEFVTPDGSAHSERVPMPQTAAPGEPTFALWPLRIPVPADGEYRLVVGGDDGSVTLPFSVAGDRT